MTYEPSPVVKDLNPFIQQMFKEYDRHYPMKGDSWRKLTDGSVDALLKQAYLKYVLTGYDDELIDIANLCAFLWMKRNQSSAPTTKKEGS